MQNEKEEGFAGGFWQGLHHYMGKGLGIVMEFRQGLQENLGRDYRGKEDNLKIYIVQGELDKYLLYIFVYL